MTRRAFHLLNADAVDALPSGLLRPRRNAEARWLSQASWLLRRKDDGRHIALIEQAAGGPRLRPLDACRAADAPGVAELLALLALAPTGPLQARRPTALRSLPARRQALPSPADLLRPLIARLAALGLDPWVYRNASGLPLVLEPRLLASAGRDRYQRPLWLVDGAAAGWIAMRRAAAADDVVLEAISGFRSHAYQLGIFRRKLARGQHLMDILSVNAAPGFSEHHSGRALDIGSPGEAPAEESFEATAAFAWLSRRGGEFGFRMSYPRDNPHGIVYEPWHWCWTGGDGGPAGSVGARSQAPHPPGEL
jgi:zinc D-Ala-D-Ala carboxypeptidase